MDDGSLDPKTPLSQTEQARREFMKIAGRLAIYTPPVLMLLMKPSEKAVAASAGLPNTPQGGHPSWWCFDADENEGRDRKN
jgi:hypothetical protein